jgi:hypothetical protein
MVDQGISVEEKYLDGVLDAYDLDQSGEIDLGAASSKPACAALPCPARFGPPSGVI